MAADIIVQEDNTLSINGNNITLSNGTNTIPVTATHPDAPECEKQVDIEVYKCYSGVITHFNYTINGTPGTQSFNTNSLELESGESITITGVVPSEEVSGEIIYEPESPVVSYDTANQTTTITLTITTVNGCTIEKQINVNKIIPPPDPINPPDSGGDYGQ